MIAPEFRIPVKKDNDLSFTSYLLALDPRTAFCQNNEYCLEIVVIAKASGS